MWANGSAWRWNAHLGHYSQTRVLYRGVAYDAAVQLVKNTNYGASRAGRRVQRDVFINMQFTTP